MFDFGAVFVITVATAAITHRVTKHGWGSFIDHDEVKTKQHYEPKHSRTFYDWDKDKGFKNPDERKSA